MSDNLAPLQCLGGKPATSSIVNDFRRLAGLPPAARERNWQVLAAVLTEPIPESADRAISEFCTSFALTRAELAPPLGAARFLVRAAAAMNLSGEAFASDATALMDGDTEAAVILLAGYDVAKELLRSELRLATLRDHGRLYTGVDWRVDVLTSSSRGASIQAAVATLTFRYVEANQEKRFTLQLQPEGIRELKRVCEQLLP